MKRTSTMIKTACFAALFAFTVNNAHAATITATVSGNWSSASTWSGGAAGSTVTTDNIVIPAGIHVTMDEDVQVNGILASLAVSGSLTSGSNQLIITQGTLSGNGTMDMLYLEVGTLGSMSYSGSLSTYKFVNSSLSLTLSSQVTLRDTLYLKAGSITLGTGSNMMMFAGSNIKVEGGSMTLGTGGVFTNTNAYNVIYTGSSKTTGIELGGTGVTGVWVNLSGTNQTLTMGSGTLTVNGTIHHNTGSIALNGSTMVMKGDYVAANGALIIGSAASNLMIESASSLTSNLNFDNSSAANQSLNNMEVNIASGGTANVQSNLTINGMLTLKKGHMNTLSTSTLTMASGSQITVDNGDMTSTGTFNGSASYGVNYIGSSKMSGIEASGSGLNNVMLSMTNSTDSVGMMANTTINGTLNLNKGMYAMHGHNLVIKGGLASTANGMFRGNSASDLTINTAASLGDTLMFDPNSNRIHNFTINTGNGSNVMLGSALTVENITFTNGGIAIYDNDITLNSTGSITGASSTKYVMINGNGSLMMNVNSSSPYVVFPVGTSTSYGPAHIQRNAASASGMIGVNTHNGIYMMGTSGADNAATQSVVNRTWDVHSSSSVDLNLKFEWTTAMEVNGFNRNAAHISHYTNSSWDVIAATSATATGTGSYQISRNGITSLSPFSVVDNNATVGIHEQQSNELAVSVYPVPVDNKLTVVIPSNENFTVEVFDAVGNKVRSKAFTSDASVHQLEMSDLNSGVYFVKISTDKLQAIKRIVKQ